MSKIVLFFISIIFINITSQSQPLLILDSEEKRTIGKYTSIFEDATTRLTVEDIIKSEDKFTPCKTDVFSSTSTASAFWIRFQVKKITNNDYFLVFDNPYINQIDIYSIDGNKPINVFKSGNSFPFSDREVKRNNFIFHLDLPKGKINTFYIRYYSTWRMEIPMSIESTDIAIEGITLKDFWYGILYGIIIMAFIYNFFLFLVIKDGSYILYLGVIFFFGLFRSLSHGFSFEFIFPNHPEFNNFLLYLCFSIIGIFIIHFTIEFLNTKKQTPFLNNGLYLFDVFYILLFIISFLSKSAWSIFSNTLLLLFPPYLIVIGIKIFMKGYKPARYYYVGTIIYLVTVLLAAFRNFGILPYSFVSFNFGDIGLTGLAIFYSLALGDRYNLLESEKKEAQKAYSKELEAKIKERTVLQEEHEKINQNLRNTNKDLSNFIYTASHDLKVPITNIEGLIPLIKSELHNKKELKTYLGMMHTSVSIFENTVNDLHKVARVQRIQEHDIGEVALSEILEEVKLNYGKDIEESGARIETDLTECKTIQFSRKNLFTIVENLISNAIKFRSSDRKLQIQIKANENKIHCIFSIADNGLGINKENQSKIFSMFKRAHAHIEGRGLGLYIIKRIIENAGGRIEVESEEGKGSTFRIYFKKQKV